MASELLANNFAVQLANGCAAGDTTITVSAAAPSALQGGQFRVLVDQEYMLVTAGQSGTTWTVTRAIEGTTAVGHGQGAWVTHVITAGALFGGNLSSAVTTSSVEKVLVPTGGDDAAALAALLPTSGGAGLKIKLVPGSTYSWQSIVRLPYGLTSWLEIDTNGATINMANGVFRAFDLYDGTSTARTYQNIRIIGRGIWNYGATVPVTNQHILIGNLINGAATGAASFKHVHVKEQTVQGVPTQASPSLQHVSLWVTATNGNADDIIVDDNFFLGGCMGWVCINSVSTATIGTVKARNNTFDTLVTPTTQTGSFGNQVGGANGYVQYYEAYDNIVSNSWDTGEEIDNAQKVRCVGNKFTDNYNNHVLVRNLSGVPDPSAQQVEIIGNVFRNINYDPSGTNGQSVHIALGTSSTTSNGTGTVTNGSRSITAATGTWAPGQTIIGTGIPTGAIVVAVSGSAGNLTLTLSVNATASNSGVALSYRDFQLGTIIIQDNESDFETAMTDLGSRTGQVIQANNSNPQAIYVLNHSIGFSNNFAYAPGVASHLVLIDLTNFAQISELEVHGVRARFAGNPANSGNFIEVIRCNPNHGIVNISDVTLDVQALGTISLASLNWLIVTVGYPSNSCIVEGVFERLKGYNGQISSNLYGLFLGSGLTIPQPTGICKLRARGCDFAQWTSSGGSDYTQQAAHNGRFFVESTVGSRTGGSTPLLQAQATITPGASPYTYTNSDLVEEDVVISGGTISALTKTPYNGSAITLPVATPIIRLRPGDAITVTYSVAPTMTKYPYH